MNLREFIFAQSKFSGIAAASGGGGGSSNDVVWGWGDSDNPSDVSGKGIIRYVTFKNHDGSAVYGRKSVVVGDDCANPITRGLMSKPTREPDAQYNYTFYGWATTPNGAADSNALKAVTEDRTLYANFSAAVRYYTITYYDSDGTTVLKTESLAYGVMPNYVAEKSGYGFGGWVPQLATVTGNASYVVKWVEKVTFANASWADIARISESGEAANHFKVGDTKTIPVTYSDGTSGTIRVAIAGFDHDDLADGTGKAGISIVFKSLLNTTVQWKNSPSTKPNGNIYTSSTLKSKVEGTLLNCLPEELRTVMKSVSKEIDTAIYIEPDITAPKYVDTVDVKLWPLSLTELGLPDETGNVSGGIVPLGERYDIFPQLVSMSTRGFPLFPIGSNVTVEQNFGYWTRTLKRNTSEDKTSSETSVYYIVWNGASGTGHKTEGQGGFMKNYIYALLGFCV